MISTTFPLAREDISLLCRGWASVFIVSPPGIHISLGICVWGYTYHGDTHITVTPGRNFPVLNFANHLHTPWTDRFKTVVVYHWHGHHGFSPSRVPEFSSSCLARYQVHKNLRHVIKTGVMAVENRWPKLCRSSVRWPWLFVRQNALFSSWYCWAYRQEWIKVSGQYSAR